MLSRSSNTEQLWMGLMKVIDFDRIMNLVIAIRNIDAVLSLDRESCLQRLRAEHITVNDLM